MVKTIHKHPLIHNLYPQDIIRLLDLDPEAPLCIVLSKPMVHIVNFLILPVAVLFVPPEFSLVGSSLLRELGVSFSVSVAIVELALVLVFVEAC